MKCQNPMRSERRLPLKTVQAGIIAVMACTLLTACPDDGAEGSGDASGGTSATGGKGPATGGKVATGGKGATGGSFAATPGGGTSAASGGVSTVAVGGTSTVTLGGSANSGGTPPTGGVAATSATGGSPGTVSSTGGASSSEATGGKSATSVGGNSALGGGASGGLPASGGSSSVSNATGGIATGTTGGTSNTGGASSLGGSSAVATGGSFTSETGGVVGTGGIASTGGSPATATGGTSSTGGTSAASALVANAVSAGKYSSCALLSSGKVQCWGADYSQLSIYTNAPLAGSFVPRTVLGITDAVEVSTGGGTNCARLVGGTIKCWGLDDSGQLGNGTTGAYRHIPVTVTGITDAVALASNTGFNCAALSGGTVQCWGQNDSGQLGNGTSTDSSVPVTVTGITNAVSVTAGDKFACALLNGGTVQCWGDNTFGKLGDGTTAQSSIPVSVGITNVASISADGQNACALMNGGTIQCWGENNLCQLGDTVSGDVDNPTPIPVTDITNAAAISVGGGGFVCALLKNGTVQCWGNNAAGILGVATADYFSCTPSTVTGITSASSLDAGTAHACVVLGDNTVNCWGGTSYKENGYPTQPYNWVVGPVTPPAPDFCYLVTLTRNGVPLAKDSPVALFANGNSDLAYAPPNCSADTSTWNTLEQTTVTDDLGHACIDVSPNASYVLWSSCGQSITTYKWTVPTNVTMPAGSCGAGTNTCQPLPAALVNPNSGPPA